MAKFKKPSDYLDESATAISYCDTNGNLLLDTLANKLELRTLDRWSLAHPEVINVLSQLFQTLQVKSDTEKENFLLTLCSSLRMFPEENSHRSGENHLARYEIAELVRSLDVARIADINKLPLTGYAKYLDIFLNTLEMSLRFAESQKFATFAAMAQSIQAPNLFNRVLTNGWEYYAEKLPQLKTFWDTLNSAEKEHVASTLFTLAAKQEGVRLNQDNTEIQKLLATQKPQAQAPRGLFATQEKTPTQPSTPAPTTPKKNL